MKTHTTSFSRFNFRYSQMPKKHLAVSSGKGNSCAYANCLLVESSAFYHPDVLI